MSGNITMREYVPGDLEAFRSIWNDIVEDGLAFPGEELLDDDDIRKLIAAQSKAIVAEVDGKVAGLYVLHPNNIGRCSHVGNASFGVAKAFRGHGIGRLLVEHSLKTARECGFRGMQFNAVVAGNTAALGLYVSLGFRQIGTIPGGFRLKDDSYSDMHILYKTL